VLAVLVADRVTSEGESNWHEGLQLLCLYLVIGVTFFFA
jgi:Ca2+:H+ antiporter